jgi:thiosulfate reductase cytochrome b subunit
MSDIALEPDLGPGSPRLPAAGTGRTKTVVIYRTALWVRIWHWINALSLLFLLLSGLQIFNAHPSLYWGQAASFDHPILAMRAFPNPPGSALPLRGVTFVAGHPFRTTGFLGASRYHGQLMSRGFPGWLTIPTNRDLAAGRRWHFFFAWLFAINGAAYFAYILIGRHLRGDLWPTGEDLRSIPRSILDHLRLKHPEGEAAARFNVLQKLAYLAVLLVLLPLMILTGLTMSPGMDAAFPILPWAFGGRQSARTIHFICAWSIVGFFAIHIFEVFAAGVFNEMRSIITGRFAITLPADPAPQPSEGAAS